MMLKKCLICKKEFEGRYADVCSWQCDETRTTVGRTQSGIFTKAILKKQKPAAHILLTYEDKQKRNDAIIDFIKEGLKLNQICVYASINLDSELFAEMEDKIPDCHHHLCHGNLIVTNLGSHTNTSQEDHLSAFDEFKNYLIKKVKNQQEKFVRLVSDAFDHLIEVLGMDQFIMLEELWHKKSFEGSRLCVYDNSILKRSEISNMKEHLFCRHDRIVAC